MEELNIEENEEQEAIFDDCVICLVSINETEDIYDFEDSNMPEAIKRKCRSKNIYMKTPCNHKFHTACLIEWMRRKL